MTIDFSNALVQSYLPENEPVWMHIPRGYKSSKGEDYCLRLMKSLYGHKRAPQLWFNYCSIAFKKLGHEVLKPYVKNAPEGIVPYLLLDKYRCHYQGSVARAIEDLGVEWDIIPGGCTGLIQPVNAGINRPWKNRVRYRLEDYLTEDFTRVAPKVLRPKLAQWCIESLWGLNWKGCVKYGI